MVEPHYASHTAKLIVKGRDREHARRRLLGAIDEFIVEGIRTTLPLQYALLETSEFLDCTYWTQFVDQFVLEYAASQREEKGS